MPSHLWTRATSSKRYKTSKGFRSEKSVEFLIVPFTESSSHAKGCICSQFKPSSHLNRLGLRFLINLIMFPCKYCAERFTALSARGLTQHRRKCQAFLKYEAEANQRRKTTVASNKIRRTKRRARFKLEDRKARLASAALGVGFLIIDKYHDWLASLGRVHYWIKYESSWKCCP